MPKVKISEFSATPANNTDIDGINIAEGCAPSGIIDAIRELMSQLKNFQAGTAGDSFNGPIGTTTAAAGVFTTLSASSTVSGTGFTNYFAAPPQIGTTTPNGAKFTFAATAPVAVTFSATAMTVDCSLSNVFTTTFTANVTTAPSFTNAPDGQTINWFITQDATGSRTMTWPTSFKWPGGTAGVLSTAANSVDLVVATYRSATGFWYATLAKAFS